MLHYLRHIRQKLILQDNVKRYFLYAIGEILLVVIGILIALQVNNWNEQNKEQEELVSVYAMIGENLKSDIIIIDGLLNTMMPVENYFKMVLHDEMTMEIYIECMECRDIMNGYPDISLEQRGYTLLSQFDNFSRMKDDSLFIAINDFYRYYITEIEVDISVIGIAYENNQKYWIDNYPWFSAWLMSTSDTDHINYMLNDPDYKNRVAYFYKMFYGIYVPHLKEYQNQASNLINLINERTKSS